MEGKIASANHGSNGPAIEGFTYQQPIPSNSLKDDFATTTQNQIRESIFVMSNFISVILEVLEFSKHFDKISIVGFPTLV
jgi:hypothetical protein